jgi:hypothetical protein
VDVRGLHVDYGRLILERKVSLKGPPPRGHTTITLNARDLGAFTQHPLFLRAAAGAVQVRARRRRRRRRRRSRQSMYGPVNLHTMVIA